MGSNIKNWKIPSQLVRMSLQHRPAIKYNSYADKQAQASLHLLPHRLSQKHA
jgi:hypothetical protein